MNPTVASKSYFKHYGTFSATSKEIYPQEYLLSCILTDHSNIYDDYVLLEVQSLPILKQSVVPIRQVDRAMFFLLTCDDNGQCMTSSSAFSCWFI